MAWMGIDGGGSTLRVVITDDALLPLAEARRSTANPSVIGRDAAGLLIREAIHDALGQTEARVQAVGIGIAGAAAIHSADWLVNVVQPALPAAVVVPSTDLAVALVGAHGALRDCMVLAGTGSVALAISPKGDQVQAGGWGYLLGDEGSGAWLALEALRACTRWHDGTAPEADRIARRMIEALDVKRAADLIPFVYRQPPPVRELASHAGLVLQLAAEGDACAGDIVLRGARALANITRAVVARAGLHAPSIQFCGGLLSADNPLSAALCAELALPVRPIPRYPPVIGAALLAKLHIETRGDHAD